MAPGDWNPDAIPLGGKPRLRPASAKIRLALERSPSDRWVWSERAWMAVIRVAEAAGSYRPAGTTAPATGYDGETYNPDWHGEWPAFSYAPAMHQGVTDGDATALADAFDRMLAKLDSDPIRALVPVDTETMRAFGTFLRRGGFTIVPVDPPFAPEPWQVPA